MLWFKIVYEKIHLAWHYWLGQMGKQLVILKWWSIIGVKNIDEVSHLPLWYSLKKWISLGTKFSCISPFLFFYALRTPTIIEFSSINFIFELIINLQLSNYFIVNFENHYTRLMTIANHTIILINLIQMIIISGIC